MPGSPLIWLAIVGLLSGPATYGVMKIQELRKWKAAYQLGFDAGKGHSATSTVTEATKTAEAIREAEAETVVPVDKQAIIELCKKRASCRERATMK